MKKLLAIKISAWLMFLFIFLSAGCKKYLEIQPEGEYTEDWVFSSEVGIQQSLNGIYVHLADPDLYGAQLSQVAIENMAQRFTVTNYSSTQEKLRNYEYNDADVANIFALIWAKGYQTILRVNKFLGKIDVAKTNHVITSDHADILKGEALAIRAFLHFDLLRLFGPVIQLNPDLLAIPYYKLADGNSQPKQTASQVMTLVLQDFTASLDLLKNDAVITHGINPAMEVDFYSNYRNRRFNYYAVKGLMARVFLYNGQTEQAHDYAKQVIDEGEQWFSWLPYSSIVNISDNPDRVFSTEVILGLDNRNLYTNYTSYFSPDLINPYIPDPDRLANTFENNENDYRYTTTWLPYSGGGRTFNKYADIKDQTKDWRFLQPLFRKTELYYMLAETETDPAKALEYLNAVRFNRGLADLDDQADMPAEIKKEYEKEFAGEGQLFFYYKRKNLDVIPNGSSIWWDFHGPSYVVPVPATETIAP